MPRTVDEWIGSSDDTPVPPRVKERVVKRQEDKCACCRQNFGGKLHVEIDHIVALKNWSEVISEGHGNRETNLQALCQLCHRVKTNADVAEKSRIARKRAKALGIKTKKTSRGFQTNRDSKWKQKIGGGTVLRERDC